jgi:prepilin-type processing-associated H-X9-DG protein
MPHEFKVGDTVEYRHGGRLTVLFVDPSGDRRPYQCGLEGGDPKQNAWFRESDLSIAQAEE